jgi:membrane protein DedA with SNARE-associated domain
MSPYSFIFSLIQSATGTPWMVPLVIILATFILEDAATVGVGVLAADGHIGIAVGVVSLFIGIALGDFGLYGLGRLAITHPTIRRWVERKNVARVGAWLHESVAPTVITVRFLPGMRLPTYLACGFFSVPFRRYVLPVLAAVLVWTPLLFTASYLFGYYTLDWLGIWRWPIAFGALFVLVLLGRRHWRHVLQESAAQSPDNTSH